MCFFDNVKLPPHHYIFQCNIENKDYHLYSSAENYWGQIHRHWCRYSFTIPTTHAAIAEQIIWFNSLIRINDQPIQCMHTGILKVKDILTENNKHFLPYQEICKKFNTPFSWLHYQQILTAIPKSWRNLLESGTLGIELSKFAKLNMKPKVVNVVYHDLIKKPNILIKYSLRWEEFNIIIDLDRYKKCFQRLNQICIATKLCDFQYRFLLGKIPTNNDLFNWKLRESNKCMFCDTNVETLQHLMIDCKYVKRIWDAIFKLFKIPSVLSLEMLLYNDLQNNHTHVYNLIVLTTKQYIYHARCQNKKSSIIAVKNEIKQTRNIELFIAKKENVYKKFIKSGTL